MTDLRFAPVDPVENALARVAYFRRSFFGAKTDLEADLCEWFGLNPGQARVLAMLYAAPVPIRREALMRAADLEWWSMRKYLARIREALGEGSLPRRDDEDAYQLTQLGRAACDEAIENVGMGRLRRELVG